MKLKTRELVTIAVFGTLWGLVEISLGTVLKSFQIPLSGVVLSAIGLMIAMIGRIFVPRRGSTLFIGVIAMLLKLFSLGGVIIGPMIAIFAEAMVAEIVLSLFSRPSRGVFLLTGGLGVLWVLIHPFVTNPILFGRTAFVVWLDLLDTGSRLIGLDTNAVIWILLFMVAVHLAVGALAGWLAWDLGRQLHARLGKVVSPSTSTLSQTEEKIS
jgi:ABC-type thiamin/hydroxymethylpyrimidine transport system permease subunit